jgi:hypothetical protein
LRHPPPSAPSWLPPLPVAAAGARGGRTGSAAGGADAVQEDAGRFVGRVLRREFAAERLGEDALVEMADQLAGAGRLGGEAVDPGEGGFDAADDFVLFVDRWNEESNPAKVLLRDFPYAGSRFRQSFNLISNGARLPNAM